jgi:diguanylate cyclase (GGDEF)-like protein/PAS domain S-box-containing protein
MTQKIKQCKHLFCIDESHFPDLRYVLYIVAILAAIVLIAIWLPPISMLQGLSSYTPLHNFLEAISIVITMLIFTVGYSSRSSYRMILLASIFFGVGLLDFSHTLSYAGMPQFITPSGVNKAIDFWFAARLLASFGLLLFIALPKRPPDSKFYRFAILITVFTAVIIIHWLFLFEPKLFEQLFFIHKKGLTPLKIHIEYSIIILTLFAMVLLLFKMRHKQSYHAASLFGALCIIVMSEFFFTLYKTQTDIYNLLGHVYKTIAYLFVYRSIFISTIETPYSELYASQKQLRESNQLLDCTLENIPNMLLLKDVRNMHFVLFNKAAEQLTNRKEKEMIGKSYYDIFSQTQADILIQRDKDLLAGKLALNEIYEHTIQTPSGIRYLQTKQIPITNEDGDITHLLDISEDITDKKLADEHIIRLAYFDQLTQLPNRTKLKEEAALKIKTAKKMKTPLAVLFLDIDKFQDINDALGHNSGDKLLVDIGEKIMSFLEKDEFASRIGGDEFILLLPNTDKEHATAKAAALLKTITLSNRIDSYELFVTASIGIALYPNDGANFETLLKRADTALNYAKKTRRNSFYFFTESMQKNAARNLQIINAMRDALKKEEFTLHYQPQVDLASGKVIGAEALIRWKHATYGPISPAEFIPLAESSWQIIQIGEWVIRTAVEQLRQWHQNGITPLVIAINLSALQFQQKQLLEYVTEVIEQANIPKSYIELELTEAAAMHDPKYAIETMARFHSRGIRMSIDDFGTGYSSLSYLKQFKIYKLKIDQSFIRNVHTDPDDQTIVTTIIAMAQNLGMRTIAEGVETKHQLEFLRRHKCDEIQGYYYSKPLPPNEFLDFLKNYPWAS